MKIRMDFVTNSSSSSFIICFARIEDEEKAEQVLQKYSDDIDVYSSEEVIENIKRRHGGWCNWLEADWAGIDVTPSIEYIQKHADSKFAVSMNREDLLVDEDGYVDYDIDYTEIVTAAILDITEENGFTDIECDYGAGRDG